MRIMEKCSWTGLGRFLVSRGYDELRNYYFSYYVISTRVEKEVLERKGLFKAAMM